jgi:hypothetical protein
MPGVLCVAGELAPPTGLVGPVPDAVVAANAAEDSRVANVRAVSLDKIMVSSPFIKSPYLMLVAPVRNWCLSNDER